AVPAVDPCNCLGITVIQRPGQIVLQLNLGHSPRISFDSRQNAIPGTLSSSLMIEPARYTCYRAAGPITVDGRLDEPSWQAAPQPEPFVDIVTGQPAWFDTRVALLWDDDCLYFGFTAQEPNVWATLKERDSRIYEDNDLEVFIGA